MNKNSLEDFVAKAKNIHGNKYDYSKVVYINNKVPVTIICHKHGDFVQRPDRHLHGCGCKLCGIESKKGLIRGVAINDTQLSKQYPSFRCWLEMLRRCYPVSEREKYINRAYKDCIVCQEWLTFSNFLKWYDENSREEQNLDKDLFSDGKNKIYSPDTCCFLPQELNNALQYEHLGKRKGTKRFYNKNKKCFEAKLNIKGKTVYVGNFDNEDDAINAYVQRKSEYIKQLAKEYYSKGLISEKIFNKLIKFKINYANY